LNSFQRTPYIVLRLLQQPVTSKMPGVCLTQCIITSVTMIGSSMHTRPYAALSAGELVPVPCPAPRLAADTVIKAADAPA
jgi:hypothetical protein